MKSSKAFKETIEAYLIKRAAEDELFAVTYKKENKSLEECCNYVMECAQKGGCQGYTDDEVFGWAVHYYDEDDIKNVKPLNGHVVVNHVVEFSEEEKANVKQKAFDAAVVEAKEELKKNMSENFKLSDEEIIEARQVAFQKVVSDQKEKIIAKKTKKKEDLIGSHDIDLFAGL